MISHPTLSPADVAAGDARVIRCPECGQGAVSAMAYGDDGFIRCGRCRKGIDQTVGEHVHTTGVPRGIPICCACWRKLNMLAVCLIAEHHARRNERCERG